MTRSGRFIAVSALVLLAGCATSLSPVTTRTPTISSPLCRLLGVADVTSDIAELHQALAAGADRSRAGQLLDGIRQRFTCSRRTQMRVMYSYTVDGISVPQPIPQQRCLSISSLALDAPHPYYEEWLACDPPANVEYLVDFNNILTENRPIDPRLRVRETANIGNLLTRFFSGYLPLDEPIVSADDFLYEAVSYRFVGFATVIEDFYTIRER